MGYTTEFEGSFAVTPVLSPEHKAYLIAFAEKRRMRRDPAKTTAVKDAVREAVGLPVGPEGGYFVAGSGFFGQGRDEDILDFNVPPTGQPGLWCEWRPNEGGTAIEWNGGEKFYDYVEWLGYLIAHFLEPWGYRLNGSVSWQGDDPDDIGTIVISDNVVSVAEGES